MHMSPRHVPPVVLRGYERAVVPARVAVLGRHYRRGYSKRFDLGVPFAWDREM